MASVLESDDKALAHEHLEKDDTSHAANASEVNDLIHNPRNWCSWGFVYQCEINSAVRPSVHALIYSLHHLPDGKSAAAHHQPLPDIGLVATLRLRVSLSAIAAPPTDL